MAADLHIHATTGLPLETKACFFGSTLGSNYYGMSAVSASIARIAKRSPTRQTCTLAKFRG